jgi:putative Mg2+ transporter-C (MgtC) family protein
MSTAARAAHSRRTVASPFDIPDAAGLLRVSARLLAAALIGGLLGWERERGGKPAGIRTHMLVALGAALFVIATVEEGVAPGDLTRVVQGVATGIGFLGGGVIVKSPEQRVVRGLTTAASIWLTAALGMAVGAGRLWIPLLGAVLAYIILGVGGRVAAALRRRARSR